MDWQRSAAGGCLVVVGGFLLFFDFVMATLSGGEFPSDSAAWWGAVLGTMFRSPDPGTFTYACLAAIGFGFGVLVSPPSRSMMTRGKAAWATAVVAAGAVLAWSATREMIVMMGRRARPDGSVVETVRYANLFGTTREVERVASPAPTR